MTQGHGSESYARLVSGHHPPWPWDDEKRGFVPRLRALSRVGSAAHRRHDDGRRNAPPLAPLLKGGKGCATNAEGSQRS
jgi:hypothetical protein